MNSTVQMTPAVVCDTVKRAGLTKVSSNRDQLDVKPLNLMFQQSM